MVLNEKLYEIPAALLAEYGLRAGGATKSSYRCDDPDAVLVPIEQIRGPMLAPGKRGLDEPRVRSILSGVADDASLPAVPVYFEREGEAVLLHGAHRFTVSKACGFGQVPCVPLSREEAEGGFAYPEGQQQ